MNSRWIKPAGATYAPRHLVTVCVAGKPVDGAAGGVSADQVWGSAAVCWSHYRDAKWQPIQTVTPETGAELLDLVHALARPRTGTSIVCPSAQHALTLSGALVRWWAEGWKWNRRGGQSMAGRGRGRSAVCR